MSTKQKTNAKGNKVMSQKKTEKKKKKTEKIVSQLTEGRRSYLIKHEILTSK